MTNHQLERPRKTEKRLKLLNWYERGAIIAGRTEITTKIEYHEKLHANKLGNLVEMEKFLERQNC